MHAPSDTDRSGLISLSSRSTSSPFCTSAHSDAIHRALPRMRPRVLGWPRVKVQVASFLITGLLFVQCRPYQIGRASCRERVWSWVVVGSLIDVVSRIVRLGLF